MKVNFNQPFRDLFGHAIKDRDGKEMIIGRALGLELFNLGDLGKEPLSQEEKYMAYALSVRMANSEGEIEISEAEATFIDRVAANTYKAGAYGNIKELITEK